MTARSSARHHKRQETTMRQKAAVASILAIYSSACLDRVEAFSSSTKTSTTRRTVDLYNDTVEYNMQHAQLHASSGTTPLVAEWQDFDEINNSAPHDENGFSESHSVETETALVDDSIQGYPSKFEVGELFFAERISSVMVHGNFQLNGNAVLNGKNGVPVGKVPPKVNGIVAEKNVVLPIVNATAKTSRVRSALCAVRDVLGRVSPIRIFSSAYDSAAEGVIADVSESPQPTAESTKKQRKEEAILARMSQRKKKQLSNLLNSVNRQNTKSMAGITSRTLTGLITALAEEAEGVSVRMIAREDTPIWRKQIDTVNIEFTRLGFKPLHMGGPDQQLVAPVEQVSKNKQSQQGTSATLPSPQLHKAIVVNADDDECPVKFILDTQGHPIADISCADVAFNQIDVDNSGALDKDEIADALVIAASAASAASVQPDEMGPDIEGSNREIIQKLAKQLVDLYDANDDGVIDRTEYQSMVEDMAALRQVQKEREEKEKNPFTFENIAPWWVSTFGSVLRGNKVSTDQAVSDGNEIFSEAIVEMANDTVPETTGKIVLEGLKIDLRQLVFGAIPFVRHVSD
jgi:EF-hand domain pair